MKTVTVVGAGLGPVTLTAEGRAALESAEVWFGAERLLELFESVRAGQKTFPLYQGREIAGAIEKNGFSSCAVLVSGDTGFFSAAPGLAKDLAAYAPRFIPGISSPGAFFSRLMRPWQDCAFLSAHGRNREDAAAAFVSLVRRNRETFCLADSGAASLAKALCEAGFENIKITAGENLGTEDERMYQDSAEKMSGFDFPSLTVLFAENPDYDDRISQGISDDLFAREEKIPMTKRNIRAAVLSRLALRCTDTVYDIGAGTGSVTVEMALAAWRGRVYAVEREESAPALIRENCRRFHIGNVTVISGEAPAALENLPPPGAVFIGGSGGNMAEIVSAVRAKNPAAKIAATAIALETAAELLNILPDAEITQVSSAEGRAAGGGGRKLHLLFAQNPVMIISSFPPEVKT